MKPGPFPRTEDAYYAVQALVHRHSLIPTIASSLVSIYQRTESNSLKYKFQNIHNIPLERYLPPTAARSEDPQSEAKRSTVNALNARLWFLLTSHTDRDSKKFKSKPDDKCRVKDAIPNDQLCPMGPIDADIHGEYHGDSLLDDDSDADGEGFIDFFENQVYSHLP